MKPGILSDPQMSVNGSWKHVSMRSHGEGGAPFVDVYPAGYKSADVNPAGYRARAV